MVKSELINSLMEQSELSRAEAEKTVDTFFSTIINTLNSGESVELRGFGSFRVRERAARVGRNPRTGESVNVPSKKIAYFKPGKDLNNKISDL